MESKKETKREGVLQERLQYKGHILYMYMYREGSDLPHIFKVLQWLFPLKNCGQFLHPLFAISLKEELGPTEPWAAEQPTGGVWEAATGPCVQQHSTEWEEEEGREEERKG